MKILPLSDAVVDEFLFLQLSASGEERLSAQSEILVDKYRTRKSF